MKRFLKIALSIPLFLGVALLLTHCSFQRQARKLYTEAGREKPFDVVIVPGVPYEKERTTRVMDMRIFWAKHLYDSGYTRNIIFSGSSVYSHFVEGKAMKMIADSLGIPPEHTFAETKAEHSTENIYYSWKLAKELGFQKIALATDPFQSAMLKSFIRKYCPGVKSVPVVTDILSLEGKTLPVVDTTSLYVADFVSIMERESFWKRFRGTMGKRIKEEVRKEKEEGK
jgi:hypothetical protein